LQQLRQLCAGDANLEIVFSYESRDAGNDRGLLKGGVDESHVKDFLTESYRREGFRSITTEPLCAAELAVYETTWARRLAFGRPRKVWRLRAVADAGVTR
jgi:hypothetical protein